MKTRYIIILSITVAILGYILGQFVPVEYLRPNIVDKNISMNDYYTRLISFVGAAATVFATLVALFKEDIKKMYEKADLNIDFKNSNILSEITETENEGSLHSSNVFAKKFEVQISVMNRGKLAARGCQIYVENFSFTPNGSTAAHEIQPTGHPLNWLGKNDSTIVIPSKARTYVTIIEILSPQSAIVASSDGVQANDVPTSSSPQIRIAGVELPPYTLHGAYRCTLTVYSENTPPTEFNMVMHWDGRWHQRLTEMKQSVTFPNN